MRKTAHMLATLLATGCAEPRIELDTVFRPPPGDIGGTNGSPPWSADELVNVMEGNGHLNSQAHQKYEAKARDMMVVPPGPIKDEYDQELVGATLGSLTNTSGMVVLVDLVSGAFGDNPTGPWRREDRASGFKWLGGLRVDAISCFGDDVDRGVRDQRRPDSFAGINIGAFVNSGFCGDISGWQQQDQAYRDVFSSQNLWPETTILVLLADPRNEDQYFCGQRRDCELIDCEGTVALEGGEQVCVVGCAMADVVYGESGWECGGEESGGKGGDGGGTKG